MIRIIILALCSLAFLDARSQTRDALTLQECIELGLSRNRQLRIERLEALTASEVRRSFSSTRLPSITGEASYRRLSPNIPDYSIDIPDDAFPGLSSSLFEVPAVLDRYNVQLSLDQTLFTGGQLTHSIRAANHEVEASSSDVQATESELHFRVRERYWRLYEALAVTDAVEAGVRSIEAHLKDVENYFEEGMALRSDVLVLKARLSELRIEEVAARRDVQIARLRLNQLIGLPLDFGILPADSPDARGASFDVAALTRAALSQRADVAARESRWKAAEARARASRGGWLPRIGAVATYYYARPNPYIFPQEDAFKGTWEAGLVASWILWDWGETRSEVRRATYAADLAAESFAERSEAVKLEVSTAALNIDHAAATWAAAVRAVESAEEAYRVVQNEHANGVALISALMEAEATYRDAQVRKARSAAGVAVARAALANAAGLPEEDLR